MLKIRLARRGRKGQPKYEIIAADARAPRDGRYLEKLGTYNPNTQPSTLHLNEEAILRRLMQGAQPTLTVKHLLSSRGLMLKKHLQIGVQKKAITQAQADARFAAWEKAKYKTTTQKSTDKAPVKKIVPPSKKVAQASEPKMDNVTKEKPEVVDTKPNSKTAKASKDNPKSPSK